MYINTQKSNKNQLKYFFNCFIHLIHFKLIAVLKFGNIDAIKL